MHGVRVRVRGQLCKLPFPSAFMWDLGIELRSFALHRHHIYLLSYLAKALGAI